MLFILSNIYRFVNALRLIEDNVTPTHTIKLNINQLIVKLFNNKVLFNQNIFIK